MVVAQYEHYVGTLSIQMGVTPESANDGPAANAPSRKYSRKYNCIQITHLSKKPYERLLGNDIRPLHTAKI